MAAALNIIPMTKPVFTRYRQMIAAEYPHLEVEPVSGSRAGLT